MQTVLPTADRVLQQQHVPAERPASMLRLAPAVLPPDVVGHHYRFFSKKAVERQKDPFCVINKVFFISIYVILNQNPTFIRKIIY